MMERVAARGLSESGLYDGNSHRLLEDGLMQMVSPLEAGTGIAVHFLQGRPHLTGRDPLSRSCDGGPFITGSYADRRKPPFW